MRKSALALRTDLEIRALKPGDKAYERPVAGVGGLFVSVGKNGDKSFRLLYRVAPERKLHAMRIGPYPEVPLKQAVTEAKSAIGLAVKGVDPAAAIRKARGKSEVGTLMYRHVPHPAEQRPAPDSHGLRAGAPAPGGPAWSQGGRCRHGVGQHRLRDRRRA